MIVASASLLLSGCVVQSVSTEVQVRDPTRVALVREEKTVIAAGAGETRAPLASGRFESLDSSAAYQATALRTADGALWIEWATKLPLQNGERSKVIGSEPIAFAKPLAALFGPDDLAAPQFDFPLCASIAYHPARYGGSWRGDARGADGDCHGGAGVVPYRLQTDWSNVVIHEKTRVDHGLAWMTIALSLIVFPPFAILIDTAHPHDVVGGQATQIGFTLGIAAIIAGFVGSMIPTLAAQDRDVWIRQ